MTAANDEIVGEGNTPTALTDLRDIGRYVSKIIVDDRTLNKMVFAYNTLMTQNQIYDLMEKISGEQIARNYVRSTAPGEPPCNANLVRYRSRKRRSATESWHPEAPARPIRLTR